MRRRLSIRRQVQGKDRTKAQVVAPKAGSERDIAIPESLFELVAQRVSTIGVHSEEGWLFSPGSDLVHRNHAAHRWRTIRAKAGLDEFTPRDLRHFYASALIAAGCDVVTVQRALGHSSATITLNTYSHLWPTAEDRTRAAAADLMQQVLAEASDGGAADSVRTGD